MNIDTQLIGFDAEWFLWPGLPWLLLAAALTCGLLRFWELCRTIIEHSKRQNEQRIQ